MQRVKYQRAPCVALASSSKLQFQYLSLFGIQRLYNEAIQSNLGQSLTKHQGVNTLGKNKKGLKIKRPPFLALASSSTFLYSLEKGLYNKAMQSKLGQSLTKHQGVNTFGKNLPQEINNSLMNYLKTQPQGKNKKSKKK